MGYNLHYSPVGGGSTIGALQDSNSAIYLYVNVCFLMNQATTHAACECDPYAKVKQTKKMINTTTLNHLN